MSVPAAPVTGAGQARDVWRGRLATTDRVSPPDLRGLVPGRDRLVVLSAHPDDESIGAQLGIPVRHFPVWMTYWSDPAVNLGGRLVTVDVDEDAAVRCFHSQLEPLQPGWGAIVPPEMLAHHDRQLLVLPGEDHA